MTHATDSTSPNEQAVIGFRGGPIEAAPAVMAPVVRGPDMGTDSFVRVGPWPVEERSAFVIERAADVAALGDGSVSGAVGDLVAWARGGPLSGLRVERLAGDVVAWYAPISEVAALMGALRDDAHGRLWRNAAAGDVEEASRHAWRLQRTARSTLDDATAMGALDVMGHMGPGEAAKFLRELGGSRHTLPVFHEMRDAFAALAPPGPGASGRVGDWQSTFSGGMFWPIDPRVEEIVLEDVAHALSLQCRFAGHVLRFYSVGDHSCRVSDECRRRTGDPRVALAGLVHDVTETWLVDLPRPFKLWLPGYRVFERRAMRVVERWAGLPEGACEWPEVERADRVLLATEKRDLLAPQTTPWSRARGVDEGPLPDRIHPRNFAQAETTFLNRYHALRRELA